MHSPPAVSHCFLRRAVWQLLSAWSQEGLMMVWLWLNTTGFSSSPGPSLHCLQHTTYSHILPLSAPWLSNPHPIKSPKLTWRWSGPQTRGKRRRATYFPGWRRCSGGSCRWRPPPGHWSEQRKKQDQGTWRRGWCGGRRRQWWERCSNSLGNSRPPAASGEWRRPERKISQVWAGLSWTERSYKESQGQAHQQPAGKGSQPGIHRTGTHGEARDNYRENDFHWNHRQLELSDLVARHSEFNQLQVEDAFWSRESKVGCKEKNDHDVHSRTPNDLPQHLVSLQHSKVRFLKFSAFWRNFSGGEILFFQKESDWCCCYEEDYSPENHELSQVDHSLALQRGEEDEAQDPAGGLTHAVTGRRVANIARLQHRQSPAVHGNILGGGQEVEDEEHGGEGHHVGDDDVLLQEEKKIFLPPGGGRLTLRGSSPSPSERVEFSASSVMLKLEVEVELADSGMSPRRVLTYCEDTNMTIPDSDRNIKLIISAITHLSNTGREPARTYAARTLPKRSSRPVAPRVPRNVSHH